MLVRPLLVVGFAMVGSLATIAGCDSFDGDDLAVAPVPEGGAAPEGGGALDAPVGIDAEGDAGPPRSLHAVTGRSFGGRDPSTDAGAAMEVGGLAVGAGGGATIIGQFRHANIDLGGGTLYNDGDLDVFVLAVDAAGKHVSSERFGDGQPQTGNGVVTTGATTFAAINHSGNVAFNGGAQANSAGFSNALVARLSTPAVIFKAASVGIVTLRGLAPDVSGGVVAFGDTTAAVEFAGKSLVHVANQDLVLGRVGGSAGTADNASFYGNGGATCTGNTVATNPLGDIAVAGSFTGGIDFGSGVTVTSVNDVDAFVAVVGGALKGKWARVLRGAGTQQVLVSAAVPGTGDFVVAGTFGGTFVTDGVAEVTTKGSTDIFVVRFDGAGNVVWAKTFGGGTEDVPRGLAVDADQHVFLTGTFRSPTIDFGGPKLANAGAGAGTSDVFVAWLDGMGRHLFSTRFGAATDENVGGVGVDEKHEITIAGTFASPFTVDAVQLAPIGVVDAFVLKLAP